jgi:two-component system, chemotaxis family, CheB/CheR fusion protein
MSSDDEQRPDDDLEELLHFIREARGFDFTGYKRSSLTRRIRKRMHDVGTESFHDYRDRLEIDADEFRQLFNTILINVTGFFRDTEAWRHLQSEVLPEVIARAGPEAEIRVWSAGCSTGEEAYSLAMVFAELLGVDDAIARLKIYATDVDDEALRDARAGVYSTKALGPVPDEFRERYFDPSGPNFVFRPDLRRRVIFGRHDITRDAPISRLDLLVCRNTLMYFNVEAQNQIVDRFHFALNPGGYLFLGKAEMLLSDGERFEVVNMRQRIFRRRPGVATPPPQVAAIRFAPEARPVAITRRHRQVPELMVEAAPYAMVGIEMDGIVSLISHEARSQFGLTSRDIGRPFHDLELSYRPAELRSLISQAQVQRRRIRLSGVERLLGPDEVQFLDIVIEPLRDAEGVPVGTSVAFLDITRQHQLAQEVKQVREDLETAYEELQSTNEELETTNEELQSSIEELETTNEELQSTNEELETTNEELQSGNEELETMNEEMRIRSAELDEIRLFFEGVLASIAAGVVVLDSGLQVRSWNRGAEDLWGLRTDEVQQQPFFSLDFGLPTDDLRDMVQQCMDTRQRLGPLDVVSVNRLGRTITCSVFCSPLGESGGGVVLLMEEAGQERM